MTAEKIIARKITLLRSSAEGHRDGIDMSMDEVVEKSVVLSALDEICTGLGDLQKHFSQYATQSQPSPTEPMIPMSEFRKYFSWWNHAEFSQLPFGSSESYSAYLEWKKGEGK